MMDSPRGIDARTFRVYCGALAGLLVAGCRPAEPLHGVEGTVRFSDGPAVSWGIVELLPVGDGTTARGQIGPDGTFRMVTGERPGVRPGQYRIVIRQPAPADPAALDHRHAFPRVHPRYAAEETSGLSVDISAQGRTEQTEIVVERAPGGR